MLLAWAKAVVWLTIVGASSFTIGRLSRDWGLGDVPLGASDDSGTNVYTVEPTGAPTDTPASPSLYRYYFEPQSKMTF